MIFGAIIIGLWIVSLVMDYRRGKSVERVLVQHDRGLRKLSKEYPEAEAFSGISDQPEVNVHYPSGRVLTVEHD